MANYISMDHSYGTASIPTGIDEWCEYVASGDYQLDSCPMIP
jgi:hypothetical protein